MKKISFIFFILLYSSSLFADDNKKEIDKLFVQLKSALNFENSKQIEDKIWDLWTTHPTKNNLTKLLADGSSAMMDNNYIKRFLKAWSVSLPIAIIAALLLGPPIKKFVDKITK